MLRSRKDFGLHGIRRDWDIRLPMCCNKTGQRKKNPPERAEDPDKVPSRQQENSNLFLELCKDCLVYEPPLIYIYYHIE